MPSESPARAPKPGKLRLYFYDTSVSRGVSSEKTSIDWNPRKDGRQVSFIKVHKVDNSG